MHYEIFNLFLEVENSSSIKLRQLFNKEDCKVIMQMKQNLICPDCNSSFDMGFHKPVLLLDCVDIQYAGNVVTVTHLFIVQLKVAEVFSNCR